MKIKSQFTLNEIYYREFLSEWIHTISKGRKYEPYLCLLFFSLGITILIWGGRVKLAGFFFCGVGIFESFKYIRFKRNWLKDRLKSKNTNSEVVIEFDGGVGMQMSPNLENKEFKLTHVKPSKKGYFFQFQDLKESIYIPHKSLSPRISKSEFIKTLDDFLEITP